jgi:hypothetical protein
MEVTEFVFSNEVRLPDRVPNLGSNSGNQRGGYGMGAKVHEHGPFLPIPFSELRMGDSTLHEGFKAQRAAFKRVIRSKD